MYNGTGWTPDWNQINKDRELCGSVSTFCGHLVGSEKRDTFLWLPLLEVKPNWRRGAQGIGDCVSWGAELCATMLMAIQHVHGGDRFTSEAATEAIYGGCRVEARNKKTGGWSDGAFGSAAAKWLRDWGVLLREDYSKETGISSHNLTKYDKKKAKQWGNYGCGGSQDKDKLDNVARRMPIAHVVAVDNLNEAEGAILNGYPISIASMAGFGRMRRDNNGIVRRSGRWAHQMMIGGVKYSSGQRLWRCFQSWGKSCSGPDPGINDQAISDCSWWITDTDLKWILTSGDCWVFGDVEGMPRRELNFADYTASWGGGDGQFDPLG